MNCSYLRDEVNLFSSKDSLVNKIKWDGVDMGTIFYSQPDAASSSVALSTSKNLVDLLYMQQDYSRFLDALKAILA
jgi:hypothetical protein